jgi:outer membrane protein assembly factor BamB
MPDSYNVYGPHGEIYRYYVNLENGWMMMWNSSSCVSDGGSFRYTGQTYNCSMDGWETHPRGGGWEWNITIPAGLPGGVLAVYPMDRIVGAEFAGETTYGALGLGDEVAVWGINLKPGSEGTMLFNTKWNTPMEWILGNVTVNMTHEFSMMPASLEDKVGIIWIKELKTHYGFSLDTGELLWGPSEPTATLDYLEGTTLSSHVPAYGNLYTIGVGGTMYCFDIKTGETLWTYDAVDPYTDFLYGNNWWLGIMFITDGKVYMAHGTHAALMPLPRGAPFICLNATSGEEIWRANGLFRQSGWGGHAIIGDSIIALHDTYSQRVFGVGKGPSATTVAASPKVSVHGSSVLVEGMVTDISPGTEEYARTARFPNGVPAVADEVMSDWMLYVYKQFPCPSDAAGVEVVVEVLDPNYNYYEVARTTSDPSGGYSVDFEPDVPGKYTVYATFEGSKAYYGSYAVTYLNVEDAPAATPAPTPEPAPMTDTYVLGIGSAILIAVIIGFVVLILIFRKR